MARKKKYAEPTNVIFRTDLSFVGKMDKVALRQGITRTDLIHKSIKQYLKTVI